MFTIRPFQPTDTEYEGMYLVEKAVFPENADTVAEVKHGDANRKPEQFFQRWVVEEDGRLIAFGHVSHPPHFKEPGRYRFNITVHPEFEGRGVGTAVYNQIWQTLQSRDAKPTIVESGCYQHHQQAVRFLQKRDYQQVMRWVITRLELPTFDAAPYTPLFAKLEAQGIELTTLPQLQTQDPKWLEKLHELEWQLTLDEPLPYTPQKMPIEQYKKLVVDNPQVILPSWFIAVNNGETIGLSLLEKGSAPGGLSTSFTGVLRDFRRRGLATALKVRAIEYAKNAGYTFIRTGNEENNPMLALNKKLGFIEITAQLAFEKRLENGNPL